MTLIFLFFYILRVFKRSDVVKCINCNKWVTLREGRLTQENDEYYKRFVCNKCLKIDSLMTYVEMLFICVWIDIFLCAIGATLE